MADFPFAVAHLRSVSQYSQSRYLTDKKAKNETHEDFDERIWKKRAHTDDEGRIVIPANALKQAVDTAARLSKLKIPGQGQSTYAAHFTGGVLIEKDPVLPLKLDDLHMFAGPMSSTGKKGSAGGSTVIRRYPVIPQWEAVAEFHIFDDVITQEVFEQVLELAGRIVGIGRFRPQNGGFNGRFAVDNIQWSTSD